MTLQELNCFLAVAETNSYTLAAQRMYISQPVVSRHISLLEKELQVSLIDRSNRRSVKLSEAGWIFYEALKSCQETFSASLRKLKGFSGAAPVISNLPKGISLPTEYVCLYNDFAVSILPRPVNMNHLDYADLPTALENGELVICEEEAVPAGKKYIRQKLSRSPVPYCLIASVEHPAMRNNPSPKPEDFIGCPVFFSETTPRPLLEKYIAYLTKLYGGMPEDIHMISSIESVYLYLLAHRAITLNTTWLSMTNSSTMRTVDLPIHTDYYVVWNPDRILSSAIESLLNLLYQAQKC